MHKCLNAEMQIIRSFSHALQQLDGEVQLSVVDAKSVSNVSSKGYKSPNALHKTQQHGDLSSFVGRSFHL
jgi:hypothetical protein